MTLKELEALPNHTLLWCDTINEEWLVEKYGSSVYIVSDVFHRTGMRIPLDQLLITDSYDVLQWPEKIERRVQTKLCDCATHQLMWGGCICGGS